MDEFLAWLGGFELRVCLIIGLFHSFSGSFEPEALAVRPPFGPQPLEQVMNGGDADHGLTRLRRVLVVLAQAPVAPLPRIGPLHDPTHRQRLELRLPFGRLTISSR